MNSMFATFAPARYAIATPSPVAMAGWWCGGRPGRTRRVASITRARADPAPPRPGVRHQHAARRGSVAAAVGHQQVHGEVVLADLGCLGDASTASSSARSISRPVRSVRAHDPPSRVPALAPERELAVLLGEAHAELRCSSRTRSGPLAHQHVHRVRVAEPRAGDAACPRGAVRSESSAPNTAAIPPCA